MTTQPLSRLAVSAAALAAAAFLSAAAARAETVDTITKSFNVGRGGTLTIDVDAGSIDVRAGNGDSVSIEVVRTYRASSEDKEKELLSRHEVKIEQSGKDVSIRARSPDKFQSVWSWFGGGTRRDIRYTVTVPQDYNATLKTSGGPIDVRGVHGKLSTNTSGGPLHFAEIRGPIEGGTSGGPIHLEQCVGDVDLHTSGGGVEVENCEGTFNVGSSGGGIRIAGHRGQITAHTSGGGIHVERIDGAVDASTSGGPVSASFRAQPTGDCRLHTSGGGVSLEVPANARIVLDAHTSGGGVSCDLPNGANVEKSRGSLRGTYNGGGPRIELSSSGGGINVEATRGVEG